MSSGAAKSVMQSLRETFYYLSSAHVGELAMFEGGFVAIVTPF